MTSHHIPSHPIISHNITSYHTTSHHITLPRASFASRESTSKESSAVWVPYRMLSTKLRPDEQWKEIHHHGDRGSVVSHSVMTYHNTSQDIVLHSTHFHSIQYSLSYFILSYLILSYLILYYLSLFSFLFRMLWREAARDKERIKHLQHDIEV